MARGTARVVSACIALMVTCVCQPMTAIELPSGDANSLLTFLAIPRADTALLPHSPDDADFAYTYSLPSSDPSDSGGYDYGRYSVGPERRKRVFLSRGWGPGGYEAPQPPQRFVRRPPLPPTKLPQKQPLVQAQKTKGIGGSRFAALVSNQQPPPNQPNTQYRRFHSIFTSGTWSPLGKRSGIHTTPEESQASSDRANEEEADIYAEKKSAVFASHGWGAGGSSTPRKQLWTPAANSVRSLMYPQAMSLSEGSWESGRATAGPQRHVSTFQGAGASQQRKPLLHLFVSNGWGPMGR